MLADPLRWYHDLPAGVPDTGPFNQHFVRDIGCAFLAVGVAQVWAAFRPAWRAPLVAVAAIFFVGHALLHVFDTARGAVPSEHWWLDLPGVYLPALVLGYAASYSCAPEEETMRLAPIERPSNLLVRIAYWVSKRQLGAVMTPMKVIYARVPRLLRTTLSLVRAGESLSLDPALKLLIATQSSLLNGCGFCADLHKAQAVQAKLGRERFRDLLDFAQSPHFSEPERAALAYTEEVTRQRKVSDATFERLRAHFDEREIVELTWLNAVGNYFNLMAVPLELESDGLEELALRAGRARSET